MADAIKRLNDAALLMNEGDASSPDTLLQVRATLQDARQQKQLSGSAALPDLERAVETIDKMIAAPEGERDALLDELGDQLDRVTECLGLELEQLELEAEMADYPGSKEAGIRESAPKAAEPAATAQAQEPAAEEPPAPAQQAAVPAEQEASTEDHSAAETEEQSSGTLNLLPQEFDAEMMPEFVTEAKELIEQAEQALLELEANPEDEEAISVVFRCFHTVKGGAAFLEIDVLARFAHSAENVLGRMRDGEIRCEGAYADLSLRAVDCLNALLEALSTAMTGAAAEPPKNYLQLLNELDRAFAAPPGTWPGGGSDASESPAAAPQAPQAPQAAPAETTETAEPAQPVSAATEVTPEPAASPESAKASAPAQGDAPSKAPSKAPSNAPSKTPSKAANKAKAAPEQAPAPKRTNTTAAPDATVRVRTARLDQLIDMVGELVIANAMVSEDETIQHPGHGDLRKKVGHLVKITRELHDISMSMRMVPLKGTFKKMARVVRDVSVKRSRKVQLLTSGEDTEIDRNMVDVVGDPLVHMLRNAVDHGIESPEDRIAAGKNPVGNVYLSAFHSSGNIVIELRDDGAGLDRDKLVQKAVDRGIIESDAGMTDGEVYALIFEAGFSTASQVTEVSGRGVGMDVVRRNIEALRGRIEIDSELGKGTRFVIRLPLTLAVSDGMLLRAGTERYIVPTHQIIESIRPTDGMIRSFAERGEMVRLRDDFLPLVRISRVFDIPDAIDDPHEGLLVTLRTADGAYALLVDELLGQQQEVVKSLENGLGRTPGVAGAAILGDGRVGLIIEPDELPQIDRGSGRRAFQQAKAMAAQAAGEAHVEH